MPKGYLFETAILGGSGEMRTHGTSEGTTDFEHVTGGRFGALCSTNFLVKWAQNPPACCRLQEK